MDEKCVCHINGYRLKDTEARKKATTAGTAANAAMEKAMEVETQIAAAQTTANRAKMTADGAVVTAKGAYNDATAAEATAAAAEATAAAAETTAKNAKVVAENAASNVAAALDTAAAALPRKGGVMLGDIDMGQNDIRNATQVNSKSLTANVLDLEFKQNAGTTPPMLYRFGAIGNKVLRLYSYAKNVLTGKYDTENPNDVILRGIAPGVKENDVVNLGQVREMVENGNGSDSGQNQNQGMSAELTAALTDYFSHVMPQFDDANGLAYVNAVLVALGAEPRGEGGDSGGEEVPDEPDQPGGDVTGDALPTDGLMAYFDLRNLGDKANVTVGTTKGVVATQGNGALYSWAAPPITGSDEYGMKSDRGMFFSSTGGSNQTELGTEFTVVSFGYGECIGPGIDATNVNPRWMLKPKYNTATGTAVATLIQGADLNGDDMTDYNFTVYRVSSSALTIINDTSRKDYNGSDYEGFVSWDSLPTVGRTFYGTGYGTAVAIYNRAISDVEIEEARAFMKTLEVTA